MTRSRLRKVIADLLVRWPRTLLTLLGLAVGLGGIAAVLIAFAILASDLDENFTRTNPPNAVLHAEGVTPAMLAALVRLPGVQAVDDRPMTGARIEISPDRWMPMNLHVVRDFADMPVARMYPQRGAWPPPRGSLLVERSGRFFVREQAGATIRVRLGAQAPFAARLGGFAFDPGQAPSTMDRVIYGYITRETFQDWMGRAPNSRLVIDAADGEAAAVAARAEAELRRLGARVGRVQVFEAPEHPHQFQLNSFVAMLGALAAFSLVMCAVLTVNLIDSIMAAEQRAIGILRAIGARRGQIVGDYMLAAMLLGLIAAAAVIPFALPAGGSIAGFIAMAVNFDLLNPRGPMWLIPFVIAVAAGIPALVAAYRVWRATGIPVRTALAPIDPNQGTALAEQLGGVLGMLPLLQRIAVRTLARRPRRVLLTAAILALGVAFFLAALNVRSSMLATVETVQRTKPHDLAITFAGAYPNDQIATWLGDFPQVRAREFWSLGEAALHSGEAAATNPMPVYSLPVDSAALRPDMVTGAWLSARAPDGVVVTQAVTNNAEGVRVGDRYTLRSSRRVVPVRVIGIAKEFGDARLYAPLAIGQALGAPAGRSNHIVVTLDQHDSGAQARAIAELEQSVAASDWQIAGVMGTRMWEQVILAHLVDIGWLLGIIAAIALFIGAMGVASSISVGVVERYREIAVLKAIGARGRAIATIFASEALMIALIGAGAALLLAPWLSRAISERFGTLMIEYPFDYRAADYAGAIALGLSAAIALIACILPVRSALRMTIRAALRTE